MNAGRATARCSPAGTDLDRMLAAYRRHSPVTDPGPHTDRLRTLPTGIPELVEIVGGIFAHHRRDVAAAGYEVPAERLPEVDFRYVRRILGRVVELDSRPLQASRPVPLRYLGTCRDASLLLCAMLRSQGVPARLRFGLARYLSRYDKILHDHVVVEYWSATEGRWKYADGRMYLTARRKDGVADSYLAEVPEEQFLTGGRLWLMSADPTVAYKFSGFMFSADAGRWLARNLLMYDLASLCGWEPMMWDAWGYILHSKERALPRGRDQHRCLDRLAELNPRDPQQWTALVDGCRRARHVRVPETVVCCSPANGRRAVTTRPMEGGNHAVH